MSVGCGSSNVWTGWLQAIRGDAKPVGGGVWELRLRFGPGYRVYYLHDGPRVILLLCGGDKATQQRDIERAYQLAEDYWNEEGRDDG